MQISFEPTLVRTNPAAITEVVTQEAITMIAAIKGMSVISKIIIAIIFAPIAVIFTIFLLAKKIKSSDWFSASPATKEAILSADEFRVNTFAAAKHTVKVAKAVRKATKEYKDTVYEAELAAYNVRRDAAVKLARANA